MTTEDSAGSVTGAGLRRGRAAAIFDTASRPLAGLVAAIDGLDSATLLRRGVLGLALLGVVGVSIELVFLRHWSQPTQMIVWPAMLALGLAFVLLARRPDRRGIQAARSIAAVVVLVAGIGIGLHVMENINAGPLDRDYGPRWERMSMVDQWTAAIIGDVGPAPTLAPGALAEISLALLLATVRHPALRRNDRDSALSRGMRSGR